jgi:menaquinone-dependent protoporphyrinogen oxidase
MDGTRVLVVGASKHGSTAEIASAIADELRSAGLEVDLRAVKAVRDVGPYAAVVLGSAVYAMRWRPEAVRFLRHHRRTLAEREVWLFQSGPLSAEADEETSALPKRVGPLAAELGVRGHITFGGKLDPSRTGFIADKMIKNGLGKDFRDFDQIRAWADDVARALGAAIAG